MAIKITMPALSPTMEEGTLAKWLVKEGDEVKSGDVIAEIETDKATMEVEAADEGKVAKIVVPAGTAGVKVNSLIAVLAEDGEDLAEAVKSAMAGSAAPAAAAQQVAPAQKAEAPAAVAAPLEVTAGAKIFASPLARRLAKEKGLDIASVKGTGPHGRIIARDVEAAKAGAGASASAPVSQAAVKPSAASAPVMAAAPSEESVLKLFKADEYEIAPHSSMRKTIARRLTESKQTIPHFYVSADICLDGLLKLRSELNAAAPMVKKGEAEKPAYKLSVNDMVIKAVALTLKQIPDGNVTWLDSGMVRHKHSDVAVAVSIPNGLITPIIRRAETKSLSAISNEMKDLAVRAKQMKLMPEEYQGGTTSVSNMGMFGVKTFSAIVNPPQSTIFAIGAGEKRPVVKDDALAIASVMTVTLSVDHRAVDGALAAELVQCLKRIIENPLSIMV